MLRWIGKYLTMSVIGGSKALRAGINQVFGSRTPVQRCRNHKVRNALGHLPEGRKVDAEPATKGASKLQADEGIVKLEKLAGSRASIGRPESSGRFGGDVYNQSVSVVISNLISNGLYLCIMLTFPINLILNWGIPFLSVYVFALVV